MCVRSILFSNNLKKRIRLRLLRNRIYPPEAVKANKRWKSLSVRLGSCIVGGIKGFLARFSVREYCQLTTPPRNHDMENCLLNTLNLKFC